MKNPSKERCGGCKKRKHFTERRGLHCRVPDCKSSPLKVPVGRKSPAQ